MAPAILALVFAGIILVFGIIISQELRNTQDGSETSTISANESLTLTGTSITTEIIHSDDCGYESWSPLTIYNGSGVVLPTGNYTVNANGSINNITYATTPIKVTYTYTWGGEACNTANKTMTGLASFADFWEIIVLAIVITIVIGLLLIVFGGKKSR